MSDSIYRTMKYLDDFEKNTGRRPSAFVCPILREESDDVDLIDGHILPQSLRLAARFTVLQRSDVDNFFGRTLEPPLIEFLNSVTYTKADFLERAKGVTIRSAGAGPLRLFVPSPRSKPPFPRLALKDRTGDTIASPFVKGTLDAMGSTEGSAEVQGTMAFHKPSIDGAMLKAANLALFHLIGYRWAWGASGRHASSPLKDFFHSEGRQSDAEVLFRDFANAFHVILADDFPFDTLNDSTVLLHDHLHDPRKIDPFALSCVFAVNDRRLLVTLPFCLDDADFPAALAKYGGLTSNWAMPHRIVRAVIGPDRIEPLSIIEMKYTYNPPPKLIPRTRSEDN